MCVVEAVRAVVEAGLVALAHNGLAVVKVLLESVEGFAWAENVPEVLEVGLVEIEPSVWVRAVLILVELDLGVVDWAETGPHVVGIKACQ